MPRNKYNANSNRRGQRRGALRAAFVHARNAQRKATRGKSKFGGPDDGRPNTLSTTATPSTVGTENPTTGTAAQVGAPTSNMPLTGPAGQKGGKGKHLGWARAAYNKNKKPGDIGFFNATHIKGKPMNALISTLKAQRANGQRGKVVRNPNEHGGPPRTVSTNVPSPNAKAFAHANANARFKRPGVTTTPGARPGGVKPNMLRPKPRKR